MAGAQWSTQQLAEFVAAVSAAPNEAAAARTAAVWAARALGADAAAIVGGDRIVASVGFPDGTVPVHDLQAVAFRVAGSSAEVPGLGPRAAATAPLQFPPGATLVVARPLPDVVTPEETWLLRGMARVASVTMRMLRSRDDERTGRERLEQLAREQAALRRVAMLVAEAGSPEDVLSAVADEVAQLSDADIVKVLRYEADGTAMVVGSSGDPDMHLPVGARFAVAGEGVAVQVHATGRPARTVGFAGPPGSVADAFRRAGVLVASGAPILVEGRLWGVVIAALTRSDPEPQEPLPLMPEAEGRMMAFTELVASAIANAQGRAELRKVADEQAALRRVATLVARAAPPAEVFAAVAAEVARIVPEADVALVGRYDSDAIEFMGGWSASGDTSFVGSSATLGGRNVATLVFESTEPARVEQLPDEAAHATRLARRWARSSAGAPIKVNGRVWGVVTVGSRYPRGLPAGIEHELADFTDLVATAVAGAQSRAELEASRAESRRAAEEQSALRRVATLVARGVAPAEIFHAVVSETRRVLDVDACGLVRVESGGSVTLIAADSALASARDRGRWATSAPEGVIGEVLSTGRPARMEFGEGAAGPPAERARSMGMGCVMGTPVAVEGRLWGIMSAAWAVGRAAPPDAELRLEQFTELVATAVANAQSRADLEASRARVVEAADDARRRIERDLHDGVQQRLVTLGLQARAAEGMAGASRELLEQLSKIAEGLDSAFNELREISIGIHPAILARGGLRPAIGALARRSPVPVRAAVPEGLQLPERVEVAAYYVASEALTNVAKHARASRVDICAATNGGCLELTIRDDGVGGALRGRGTGLVGLADRVEALGGTLRITSPPDHGTTLEVTLPCAAPDGARFDRA